MPYKIDYVQGDPNHQREKSYRSNHISQERISKNQRTCSDQQKRLKNKDKQLPGILSKVSLDS